MPYTATRDTENYWRTRYGLPPDADNDKVFADKSFRDRAPLAKSAAKKKRLIKNAFPSARPRRRRIWFVFPLLLLAGAGYATFPSVEQGAATGTDTTGHATPAIPDFNIALREFSAAREASVVALRGYLLTDGEGFRQEWLDATMRLQSAANILEVHSATWTDGQRLVEFVETKRLLARLLAEQRAISSIAGTVNRYPGLQLYMEDVRPAFAEAQGLGGETMTALLAVSSPDDVGPIGPLARLRGDLGTLEDDVGKYIAASDRMEPPASADAARFSAMRDTLASMREQVPGEMRPRLDRMAALLSDMEEKLGRIFALRAGERWDYARYAFETRVMPLAEKLEQISGGWKATE